MPPTSAVNKVVECIKTPGGQFMFRTIKEVTATDEELRKFANLVAAEAWDNVLTLTVLSVLRSSLLVFWLCSQVVKALTPSTNSSSRPSHMKSVVLF